MGFLLLYTALHLLLMLAPLATAYNLFRSAKYGSERSFNYAYLLDVAGSFLFGPFLNDWAAVRNAVHQYGQHYISISETTGYLWRDNLLRTFGKFLVKGLHFIDPYHVQKTIGEDYPKDFKIPLGWNIARISIILSFFGGALYLDWIAFSYLYKVFSFYLEYYDKIYPNG